MKKITMLLAIIAFFTSTNHAIAQKTEEKYNRNFKIGFGLNTGIPLNKPYEFSIGGDARLQYNLTELVSICLTSGYNTISVKDSDINYKYIPIKVGYKSFLLKNGIYLMGEVGTAISLTKEYRNSILFAPTLGYATKKLDISLRYDILRDIPTLKDGRIDDGYAQLMVRLAYGFNL
jgi:hypothetical protein